MLYGKIMCNYPDIRKSIFFFPEENVYGGQCISSFFHVYSMQTNFSSGM